MSSRPHPAHIVSGSPSTGAPAACSRCGSTFLLELRAAQYSAGGYNTAKFRPISQQPETVFICLCGHLVDTKNGGVRDAKSGDAAALEGSFQKAVAAPKMMVTSSASNG